MILSIATLLGVVETVWPCRLGMYGEVIYIHDVVFNRGDKTVTRPIVVEKLAKHKPHKGHFEANNNGDEYCDRVRFGGEEKGDKIEFDVLESAKPI